MVWNWPIAPYREEVVTDRFDLDIELGDFFNQASLAVGAFVHLADGDLSPADASKSSYPMNVILLYVGEEGTILQMNTTIKSSSMMQGAPEYIRRYGFKARDCECRLFNARLNTIHHVGSENLLQTTWSGETPVVWVLTTLSVFGTKDGVHDFIRYNMSTLYVIPDDTLAYLYRDQSPESAEEDWQPLRYFKRFETDAFSCDVYSYHFDGESKESMCVLSEPSPRWPICKSLGDRFPTNMQGLIAEATSEEFHDYIMSTFSEFEVKAEEDDEEEDENKDNTAVYVEPVNRSFSQLKLLLTLDEEELSHLLRRVTLGGRGHLLRAPWIVTRNMYFARRGTVLPLGADTWTGGHVENNITEHLGRRAFMIPARKDWADGDNKIWIKWNDGQDKLVLDPDRKILKGAQLVMRQHDQAMEATNEFNDERRDELASEPPVMNVNMVITSFSYTRVEMYCVSHQPLPRPFGTSKEEVLRYASVIQDLVRDINS